MGQLRCVGETASLNMGVMSARALKTALLRRHCNYLGLRKERRVSGSRVRSELISINIISYFIFCVIFCFKYVCFLYRKLYHIYLKVILNGNLINKYNNIYYHILTFIYNM